VLHTVVDGLPSGDTGDTVPVVLPTNGVGIVPNAIPGIIVVDGIIVAVLPTMDVEAVVGTIDGVGVDVAVAAGAAAAAAAVRDDATGIVVPKKIGHERRSRCCGQQQRRGRAGGRGGERRSRQWAVSSLQRGVEGVIPIAPPVADMAITGTDGVPGAICPVGAAQVTTVPGSRQVRSQRQPAPASCQENFGWVVAEKTGSDHRVEM